MRNKDIKSKDIKEYKEIEKAVKQAFKDVDKYISNNNKSASTSSYSSKTAGIKC